MPVACRQAAMRDIARAGRSGLGLAASRGTFTPFQGVNVAAALRSRIGGSAVTGDGDKFTATGAPAALACGFRDRFGDVLGIDAAERGRLGEFARLTIGAGGMDAAGLAVGEAFIDAAAVRLIGDDEDPVIGRRRRGEGSASRQDCNQGGQASNRFHGAPEWLGRVIATPKRLKMINLAGPAVRDPRIRGT